MILVLAHTVAAVKWMERARVTNVMHFINRHSSMNDVRSKIGILDCASWKCRWVSEWASECDWRLRGRGNEGKGPDCRHNRTIFRLSWHCGIYRLIYCFKSFAFVYPTLCLGICIFQKIFPFPFVDCTDCSSCNLTTCRCTSMTMATLWCLGLSQTTPKRWWGVRVIVEGDWITACP